MHFCLQVSMFVACWDNSRFTYGLSVHVKTSKNPHDRTSDSASLLDLGLDVIAKVSISVTLGKMLMINGEELGVLAMDC